METLHVVKVGGAVVEDAQKLERLLQSFAALPGRKLLVHGGGRAATALSARLGIETRMVGGRRITDAATLETVVMVYGGLVNKSLVARLQALGIPAAGLCGADFDCVRSVKRPVGEVDYGFVGDIVSVDAGALSRLLEAGTVPVIAPITHDGAGQLLNTNADAMASAVAAALSKYYAVSLKLCFEKPGVLADPADDGSVIPVLAAADIPALTASGTLSGGMLPKVEGALKALEQGVGEVVITSYNALAGGTRVCL
jgi:acetylglutamate kinase